MHASAKATPTLCSLFADCRVQIDLQSMCCHSTADTKRVVDSFWWNWNASKTCQLFIMECAILQCKRLSHKCTSMWFAHVADAIRSHFPKEHVTCDTHTAPDFSWEQMPLIFIPRFEITYYIFFRSLIRSLSVWSTDVGQTFGFSLNP